MPYLCYVTTIRKRPSLQTSRFRHSKATYMRWIDGDALDARLLAQLCVDRSLAPHAVQPEKLDVTRRYSMLLVSKRHDHCSHHCSTYLFHCADRFLPIMPCKLFHWADRLPHMPLKLFQPRSGRFPKLYCGTFNLILRKARGSFAISRFIRNKIQSLRACNQKR